MVRLVINIKFNIALMIDFAHISLYIESACIDNID